MAFQHPPGGHSDVSDSLSSHPGSEDASGERSWARNPVVILAVFVLVGVGGVLATVDFLSRPDWPTRCGITGHPNWCAQPSATITGASVVGVVQSHCPGLSSTLAQEVVPQPLAALDLADHGTLAKTSGSASKGREEVLLGRPGDLAWVTRWVGGARDGQWEVSCPGDAQRAPGLRLQAEQMDSTIAAVESVSERHIDFGAVARQLVTQAPDNRGIEVSFGFLECATDSLDFRRLQRGSTFSCVVEVYGQQGKGAYRGDFEVIGRRPYFRPL